MEPASNDCHNKADQNSSNAGHTTDNLISQIVDQDNGRTLVAPLGPMEQHKVDEADHRPLAQSGLQMPQTIVIAENKQSLPETNATSEKNDIDSNKKQEFPQLTCIPNTVSSVARRAPSAITRRMRQPFKILIDIWGVLTSYDFRAELLKYIDLNLKDYLFNNFDKEDIKLYVEDLVTRTNEELTKFPEMPTILIDEKSDKEAILKSIVDNLNFRRHHKNKSLIQGLDTIFNQIWNEGYTNKTLRPHLFPDVLPNFKKWHAEPFFIKIYTFASGPVEIQKLFLNASVDSEVTEYITSGFDAHHRYKYDPSKYRGVLSSLCERDPKNLFYLTDSPTKGKEARKVGMTVFIVLREGNRRYKPQQLESFTAISSFDEFEFYEFC